MAKFSFVIALFIILAMAKASIEEEQLQSRGDDARLSTGRVLLQHYTPRWPPMTCNIFPRVCRAEGSPGPDCCGRQCVNVDHDGANCGQCGRRCRYGEACCGGNCMNLMWDPKNCGGCRNGCEKGGYCRYGMCSYA